LPSEEEPTRAAKLQHKTVIALIAHCVNFEPRSRKQIAVHFLDIDYELTLRTYDVRTFFATRSNLFLDVAALIKTKDRLRLRLETFR